MSNEPKSSIDKELLSEAATLDLWETVKASLGANLKGVVLEFRAVDIEAKFVAVGDSATVGRSDRCDCVVVNDRAISRTHFEVTCQSDGVYVADLNSRNGTQINSTPLAASKRRVDDGDEITAGSTRCIVRLMHE